MVYPNNGHKEKLEEKWLTRNIKTPFYLITILPYNVDTTVLA